MHNKCMREKNALFSSRFGIQDNFIIFVDMTTVSDAELDFLATKIYTKLCLFVGIRKMAKTLAKKIFCIFLSEENVE